MAKKKGNKLSPIALRSNPASSTFWLTSGKLLPTFCVSVFHFL